MCGGGGAQQGGGHSLGRGGGVGSDPITGVVWWVDFPIFPYFMHLHVICAYLRENEKICLYIWDSGAFLDKNSVENIVNLSVFKSSFWFLNKKNLYFLLFNGGLNLYSDLQCTYL